MSTSRTTAIGPGDPAGVGPVNVGTLHDASVIGSAVAALLLPGRDPASAGDECRVVPCPVGTAVTLSVMVADAVCRDRSEVHVTVWFCTVSVPCVGTTEPMLSPVSTVSVTCTLVAPAGPSLWTERVAERRSERHWVRRLGHRQRQVGLERRRRHRHARRELRRIRSVAIVAVAVTTWPVSRCEERNRRRSGRVWS